MIENSLFLAVTGASIGVALAVLQGYYLTRGNPRHRALAEILLSLPLGIPGIILGLGFLILALRTPLYSTLSIILIAYIARFLPFATRNVTAMFLAINPELEQSARSSGANWVQTMRHIVMPLLRPSLVASWLLLFVIFIRELGRDDPALCAGHRRDDQRRDGGIERTQLRLCRGARRWYNCSCCCLPFRCFISVARRCFRGPHEVEGMSSIRIEGLTKRYGTVAAAYEVSFTVPSGGTDRAARAEWLWKDNDTAVPRRAGNTRLGDDRN